MNAASDFETALRTAMTALGADAIADEGLADRLIDAANTRPRRHLRLVDTVRRWRGPLAAAGIAAALVATPYFVIHDSAHHTAAAPVTPAPVTSRPSQLPKIAQLPVLPGVPVYANPPRTAPASCLLPDEPSPTGHSRPLLTVDANPVRVTVVWYLPRKGYPCVAPITYGDAALAQQLAQSVRVGGSMANVDIACFNTGGYGMQVYFSYADKSSDEVVTAKLDGCDPISDPGRTSRAFALGQFLPKLRTIAPPGELMLGN